MADSTIPNLVAVTVPAVTDLFGVRQSGDTRDKKLTVTQLLTLVPAGGDVTKVGTPVNNQISVWTGDGTLEGDPNFIYDGVDVQLTGGDFQILGTSRPLLRDVESSATIPTILPIGTNTNTGFGGVAGADEIQAVAGGVRVMRWRESTGTPITRIYGDIESDNASGPGMINETSSDTNPTLVPAQSDQDTGIGRQAADALSLIAGGVEIARAIESTNDQFGVISGSAAAPGLSFISDLDTGVFRASSNALGLAAGGDPIAQARFLGAGSSQFLIAPAVQQNNAALPSLGFGDGNTGFYESADNILRVAVAAAARWEYSSNSLKSINAAGPELLNAAASSSFPTFRPNQADPDTGVGWNAADSLVFVAGGVAGLFITEAAAVISVQVQGDLQVANGAGPVLLNVSASSSVPTIIPNRADPDTGIGRDAVDGLAMIAGGLDCMRVREIGSARAVGFYTTTPIILQTGVAVTSAGIHAALVALGLITA